MFNLSQLVAKALAPMLTVTLLSTSGMGSSAVALDPPPPAAVPGNNDKERFRVALEWLRSVQRQRFPEVETATRLTYEGGHKLKGCIPKGNNVDPRTDSSQARMACFYDAMRQALDEEIFEATNAGFEVDGTWTIPVPELLRLDTLVSSLAAETFHPRPFEPSSRTLDRTRAAAVDKLRHTKTETWTFFRILTAELGEVGGSWQMILLGLVDTPAGPKVGVALLIDQGAPLTR